MLTLRHFEQSLLRGIESQAETAMVLEDYLAPRPGDDPSGADLEYDPAFMDLMIAAQPVPERQEGASIVPGTEPDYKEVAKKALAVLERSHDLRVAVVLAQARLRLDGYEGLAGVTAFIRGCLETLWDTCHPRLDPDDDDDPTMRINAVMGLSDQDTFLRLLRLAPLAESRTFGRVSLRDLAVAAGEITPPAGSPALDPTAVAAAFKETPADLLRSRLAAARAALADMRAIGAVFDERTPGAGPDLDPPVRLLRRAAARLAEAVGEPEGAAADEPADGAAPAEDGAGAASPASAPPVPGTVASRADVVAALDRIMAYYARHEPSSPIPLLLQRVRRLVGADFMAIMAELVPDGTDTVRGLAGIRDETE
jgi:type VI secretion system protein ImpA